MPPRGHYYLHNKNILSNLVQLAIALLAELGLNKAAPRDMPHTLLISAARGSPEQFAQPEDRTMEEKRLAVGCFLVTSMCDLLFLVCVCCLSN